MRPLLVGAAAAVVAVIATGTLIITNSKGPASEGPIAPTTSSPETPQAKDIHLKPTNPTITEQELASINAFLRSVQIPTEANVIPLAEELAIGVGTELATVQAKTLTTPDGWLFPLATQSRPAGPYDMLLNLRDYLRTEKFPALQVGLGDKEQCSGSSVARHALDRWRGLTIQPILSTRNAGDELPCVDWFSISLYFDTNTVVTAVVADVYDAGLLHTPSANTSGGEGDAASSIGARFLDFSRGALQANGLPIDTPVTLYVGNKKVTTISAREADTAKGFLVCVPDYAQRKCAQSAVETVANNGNAEIIDEAPSCMDSLAPDLEPDRVGAADVVVLGEPTADCLTGWAVEVFFNDEWQIVAVNLLLASP